jgi:hypothetical protein
MKKRKAVSDDKLEAVLATCRFAPTSAVATSCCDIVCDSRLGPFRDNRGWRRSFVSACFFLMTLISSQSHVPSECDLQGTGASCCVPILTVAQTSGSGEAHDGEVSKMLAFEGVFRYFWRG